MKFIITRGAGENKLIIAQDGKKHTFDLSEMKECKGLPVGKVDKKTGVRALVPMGPSYRPILPAALRQMVVDAWAVEHGFEPIYTQQIAA